MILENGAKVGPTTTVTPAAQDLGCAATRFDDAELRGGFYRPGTYLLDGPVALARRGTA
jgi:hypothetical protein